MNLNSSLSKELGKRLEARRLQEGLRHKDIAASLGISQSQVSRACAGQFRSLSQSIMQICKLLNVEAPLPGIVVEQEERLTAGILRLWDRTPEGADRLLRLLETVDEVRKAPAAGPAPGRTRKVRKG